MERPGEHPAPGHGNICLAGPGLIRLWVCGCQFASRYIEEITRKTGNYKKFTVFVQMLMQSLDGQSDSVFIDLLTYSDLELLKSRKTGKSEPSTASKANNKRYLIMTYAVEYDRVHYPLPLSFEEAPDPASLKMTISRLRQELADLKGSVVRAWCQCPSLFCTLVSGRMSSTARRCAGPWRRGCRRQFERDAHPTRPGATCA